MANTFDIGDIKVTVISDGEGHAPGTLYFQGTTAEQWEPHKRWLNHEGHVTFPFTCFVVQTGDRTVLIDTGLGPVNMFGFTGGALRSELASAGFKPGDIDTVFVTHLHIDHAGNVALPAGDTHKATFPKATYRWSSTEDNFWRTADDARARMAGAADMLPKMFAAIEGMYRAADDGDVIAPGVNVIATPGHTLGHAGIVLSSRGERAFILGDAISCPAQLEEPEWSGMGDMDKGLARRTQEAVAREAEETGALLTAAHFPGLTFGRVLTGKGKRYWEPVKPGT